MTGHGDPGRLTIEGAGIRIDTMPSDGRDLRLSVDTQSREALAAQLGLTSIERLDVVLHAEKFRGGVRVTGRIEAEVVQPSVVSLEPVGQSISESVDRVFLPGGEKPYAGPAGAEVFVDLEGEDVPDHFEGPEADLSDLIVETVSLAIDPYPKAEGEHLEDMGLTDDTGGSESPFAALGKLKKDPQGE